MNGLLEIINWISTVAAICGAFMVSNNDSRGFYIWLFSNSFFTVYNFYIANYAGAFLFMIYFFITLNGVHNSRKRYGKRG
jgi:hypothetical protein